MRDQDLIIQNSIKEIQEKITEGTHAIIAVSGGVDSTVAAVLCSKAVRDRLTAVHVDTGLMRKGESDYVVEVLKNAGVNVKLVNASERFFEALKGVTDTEEKRKIIGKLFIDVFDEEAKSLENVKYLVQGTIAPDWIESGQGVGGKTNTIKSHHNVGGLPENMGLKVIEPLRDLYKDEVRLVAKHLDVPEPLYVKQPFPGPGLAVRSVGEVNPDAVRIVQEADDIVREIIDSEIEKGNIERPWQYFAALLPIRTVGFLGDLRAYGRTIVVRIVESADGMTANFLRLNPDILAKISTGITNAIKDDVNRVVYDITNKPPGTIEWE